MIGDRCRVFRSCFSANDSCTIYVYLHRLRNQFLDSEAEFPGYENLSVDCQLAVAVYDDCAM